MNENLLCFHYFLLVVMIILGFAKGLIYPNKKGEFCKENKGNVKNMSGEEFEIYCSKLLIKNGYTNIKLTPRTGDNGVDIIANKNGVRYAVQCKRYNKNVSNSAVQEVFTGKKIYNCDRAIVMTNSSFTLPAKDAAKKLDVLLMDHIGS